MTDPIDPALLRASMAFLSPTGEVDEAVPPIPLLAGNAPVRKGIPGLREPQAEFLTMSDLLSINVNDHTERKNGLTYLSWAWAWAEVLKADPKARYEVRTFNGLPACFMPGDTAMVCVEVVINGLARECWLPVMDNRNKAIKLPDSFAINTAIMRCMTKAVSLHGLGLYIYAGEDLPQVDAEPEKPVKEPIKPTREAKRLFSPDEQASLRDLAMTMLGSWDVEKNAAHMVDMIEEQNLEQEQLAALADDLPSDMRAAIKVEMKKRREASKVPA